MAILTREKGMRVKLFAPQGFYKKHIGTVLKAIYKHTG